MPEPPDVSVWTRYVLENPWPLAIILAAATAVLAWTGFREGIESRQKASLVPLALAIVIVAIGMLIKTPGEHARGVVTQFVEANIGRDMIITDQLLADEAVVAFGSPANPGFDREYLMDKLAEFHKRFTIDSNSITMLKSYTGSSDSAVVHLACWTTVREIASPPTPSQWVLRVDRQPDGSWKIIHLTCVSVNGRTQSGSF